MLFRIIPQALIARQNEIELTIYFKNGSLLILKGADEPDTLRGAGVSGVVLDEFAKIKFEAWEVIEPMLRANDGWCWFIGTPKGKNHLYRFYQRGQEQHHEWKSWLLKASQSGIIAQDQLEESRTTSTQATWNQEWECEFLEGEGAVFKGIRDIMTASPRGPETGHFYSMGVDLAKTQDYTVISVFDRMSNTQVYRDRFRGYDWRYVKTKIKAVSEHYNKALVTIDSTGVGDPIYEDLAHAKVNVVSFKFTEMSKRDLIQKHQLWTEQKRVKLINQQEALFEYDNYSYTLTPEGKVKYGAPEGYNDDIVTADALGVWDLTPIYRDETEKRLNPLQQFYNSKVDDFIGVQEYQNEWNEWANE